MFLLAVLVFAFSGSISAQTIGEDNQVIQLKSETTALQYSLYGTLFPVGISLASKSGYELAIAGVLVGPSLGYFYGGKADRGMKGILIRTGTVALTWVIGGIAAQSAGGGFSGLEAAIKVCAVGAGVVLIEAIYDIATVKSTVRKHNEELRQKNQTSVTLLPKYFADSGAGGLELRITF